MVLLRRLVVVLAAWMLFAPARMEARDVWDFNGGWRFHLGDAPDASRTDFDDSGWKSVQLPHTPRIAALVIGADGPESEQWQGICWYRKTFRPDESVAVKRLILELGAAMRVAAVWVNGKSLGRYVGDYLPVVLDVTDEIRPGEPNVVAVRLDNFDNRDTGPKPLAALDFNFYGGLYRGARMTAVGPLHITNPLLANKQASGGVFVTFPSVSATQAIVRVRTHLQNDDSRSIAAVVRTSILGKDQALLGKDDSPVTLIPAGKDSQIVQELEVSNPPLWSLDSPNLCTVVTEIVVGGDVVDRQETRVGIRTFRITEDGFWLNGKKTFLRGVNRHQEYPYIGYALSDNAQYRDAKKIKEAGFDYIRLSHYPPSPAFLDACDELGIVVMNCIAGWQYFANTPAFKEHHFRQCADLIRRDRNHPCVLLWEVSLNETRMTKDFMEKMRSIADEELPGDQCFTCGWAGNFDVFIQARQHGGCRNVKGRPCVVSEYGDWEYYAQNAGLNQEAWKDLQPEDRSSRQSRGAGDKRLLQQALNFQEAHNDNRKTRAFADGLWVMFDYNRGYSPDLETSGCMDIFRLPKPAYYFFQSQRDADANLPDVASGPMVYIANQWIPSSPTAVRIFSNCDRISLFVNDKLIGTQRPDDDHFSTNLAHPPYTFHLESFEPGSLRAVGSIDGKEVASHTRITPLEPTRLRVEVDLSGRHFQSGVNDVLFVHAVVEDARGNILPDESREITFAVDGPAELIGDNPARAEAGIASILLRANSGPGKVRVSASAPALQPGASTIDAIEGEHETAL
jgi:beta-galactosidase